MKYQEYINYILSQDVIHGLIDWYDEDDIGEIKNIICNPKSWRQKSRFKIGGDFCSEFWMVNDKRIEGHWARSFLAKKASIAVLLIEQDNQIVYLDDAILSEREDNKYV